MPFCRPYSGVLLLRITLFSQKLSLFTELIWIDDAAMSSKVVIFDGRLFPSHIPAGRSLVDWTERVGVVVQLNNNIQSLCSQ